VAAQDCSGNRNTAALRGSGFDESRASGNGASNEVYALSGTTLSVIAFGTVNMVIQSEFTVCSVTRYTGGVFGRILQGGGANWLHGHWNGAGYAGVAYYGFDKTVMDRTNVNPNTDWVVMCGTNAGLSQLILVNGVDVATGPAGGTGGVWLWVNGGDLPNETSDFAIAEVVVWPRGLTAKEMRRVSKHLMDSMGMINMDSMGIPPTSPPPSPAAVPDQYLKNDDFDPPPAAYPEGMNAWYCPGAFDLASNLWQDCTVAQATRRSCRGPGSASRVPRATVPQTSCPRCPAPRRP